MSWFACNTRGTAQQALPYCLSPDQVFLSFPNLCVLASWREILLQRLGVRSFSFWRLCVRSRFYGFFFFPESGADFFCTFADAL